MLVANVERTNYELINELSVTLDELEALKRTVCNGIDEETEGVPSFLRVLQAEQLIEDSKYGNDENQGGSVNQNPQRIAAAADGTIKRLDDSSIGDEVENEISIPQESSISANVPF